MDKREIIYVDTVKVKCEGEKKEKGHPLIYLNLTKEGYVECPYCSKLFKLGSKKG